MTNPLKAVALAATVALASPAVADDKDTVRAFYSDILSNPAETTSERYFELFSPDVVSIPTPPGGEGAQGMLNTVAFLGQVVPDLKWEPDEIIETGDGRFVVRGTFAGTPVGPFLGVDPATGKRFEAMSIDIVTVEDGLISHIYHLEDWTGVIAQLTAE
jgi:predicted ester cyclase